VTPKANNHLSNYIAITYQITKGKLKDWKFSYEEGAPKQDFIGNGFIKLYIIFFERSGALHFKLINPFEIDPSKWTQPKQFHTFLLNS
jgi:hypothetical protein